MALFKYNSDKYETILEVMCKTKGISREELFEILKDKECKYLLFLLLKKYRCADMDKLTKDFLIASKKSVNYNFRKAEERFFVNKQFRDLYFEMENIIEENI